MMKKKATIISAIAGIFILGLCVKLAVGSRDIPVIENAALEERAVSDELSGQSEQEKTESEETVEAQSEQEPKGQDKVEVPKRVDSVKPIVKLNDEKGELRYDWDYNNVRVDADTLLLVCDCYFPTKKLQQKIFFLVETPFYVPREVFRQDSKIWDEDAQLPERLEGITVHPPELLEYRMARPHPVDGGYVYEVDGMLYFLDGNFQEASLLCNLYELMGDSYSFSIGTYRTCDVTADAARMIVCMDEGLYEYDLENGGRKLLESTYFAPHEIDENDCLCGQRDFRFFGPVEVEYAPDGQSYAFLTGTEEADWGDITGIVLRSGKGEALYQKESDYMRDFKWVESEDAAYLAVFYKEYDEKNKKMYWLMDRVDVYTGEVETFEVPKEILCWGAGFLDADTLLYINYDKQDDEKKVEKNDKDIFEVYRLSSGERQDLEITGDVDWEMMVFDIDGYDTIPVRYPK